MQIQESEAKTNSVQYFQQCWHFVTASLALGLSSQNLGWVEKHKSVRFKTEKLGWFISTRSDELLDINAYYLI